jgi:hypothetical protein
LPAFDHLFRFLDQPFFQLRATLHFGLDCASLDLVIWLYPFRGLFATFSLSPFAHTPARRSPEKPALAKSQHRADTTKHIFYSQVTLKMFADSMIDMILRYLGQERDAPTLAALNRLLAAYARRVPWETVSRVVRRVQVAAMEHRPRSPELFWNTAQLHGTGGTCFESNYAFYKLLRSLGYETYLTINNMAETIGCHTATIVCIDGQKYIVDAGFPTYAALPFEEGQTRTATSEILTFSARSLGDGHYEVRRDPHPKPYAYTLIDVPVSTTAYEVATLRDYGTRGLFLDCVVINKVINDQAWRFSSMEQPYCLQRFHGGSRIDTPIEDGRLIETLHNHFGIDSIYLKVAFETLSLL